MKRTILLPVSTITTTNQSCDGFLFLASKVDTSANRQKYDYKKETVLIKK